MKRMKYFGAAALLALLAGCSNDDMENISYQDDPLAVRINATAGKNVITRSYPIDDTNQTAFQNGDRISVGTDDQNAVIYRKESTGWTPESGYLKWTTSPLGFNAYYPVGENNASMTTFDVPGSQNSIEAIEKADYMTYSGIQSKPASASESITLTLERKMARVVIDKIEFLDQYATGYSVTAITVHGNTSGYENGTPKTGNIEIDAYQANGKFYALLSPTTLDEAGTFLTVTVKADNAADTENGTGLLVKGIPSLAASNSYTYTLTVGKDMIAVSSVTVKEWNDGGSVIGSEGEAEEKTEGPDASTHTITTSEAGQIANNIDWIATAIGDDNTLVITGPMNENDIAAIKTYLISHSDAAIALDLKEVTELTAMPETNFYDSNTFWKGLKSIVLPDVMTTIGAEAFRECTSLESVTLPEGLKEIKGCAFYSCTSLAEIILPDGLEKLNGDNIFGYTGITEITIPSSVTFAYTWALGYMESLTTVHWETSADIPNYCFQKDTSLSHIWFTTEKAPGIGTSIFQYADVTTLCIHIPATYNNNSDYADLLTALDDYSNSTDWY